MIQAISLMKTGRKSPSTLQVIPNRHSSSGFNVKRHNQHPMKYTHLLYICRFIIYNPLDIIFTCFSFLVRINENLIEGIGFIFNCSMLMNSYFTKSFITLCGCMLAVQDYRKRE